MPCGGVQGMPRIHIGNPSEFNGEAFVAFLDILGFSHFVLKHWKNTTENPLRKLAKFKETLPVNMPEPVTELQFEADHFSYISRVQSYSDSIIVCFAIPETRMIGHLFCGLMCVVRTCLQIWRNAIKEGYTLRGAIELDDVFWNQSEVVGPALVKACGLESQVAKVSRIVVGPELNQLLANLLKKLSPDLDLHLRKLFVKDPDGYIILNPREICKQEERYDVLNKLLEMRNNQGDYFTKEKYTNIVNALQKEESLVPDNSEFGKY